jgi:hypothetical protein
VPGKCKNFRRAILPAPEALVGKFQRFATAEASSGATAGVKKTDSIPRNPGSLGVIFRFD